MKARESFASYMRHGRGLGFDPYNSAITHAGHGFALMRRQFEARFEARVESAKRTVRKFRYLTKRPFRA